MGFMYDKALAFATERHEGQVRKYTGEPYIKHCEEVVEILKRHCGNIPWMTSAAILHDTVEDTDTTLDEIEEQFGDTVSEYVRYLTDISNPPDGNRKERKRIDREHLLSSPHDEVLLIKCADLISNTLSIMKYDPDFAKVYLPEKILMLEGMKDRIGNHSIYKEACKCANPAERKRNE